jgi:peptide/nickel transport system substrate-binding protein
VKNKLLFGLLVILVIAALAMTACTSTTTNQTTSSSTPTTTSSINTSTTTQSTVTTSTVSTSTTSTQANWWDKFGTPQYGGTITIATGGLMGVNFDVMQMVGAENDMWYESLFEPSWDLDRSIYSMTAMYYPDQYWTGNLAESWTIDSPSQITVKLQQGVKWQNKAPANGREFVATDVQAHYDRLLGTGGGYTQPAPMYAGMVSTWDKVIAADKYTVVFKFKVPSAQNFQTIADRFALNEIECPEWVALGGGPSAPAISDTASPLTDWKQVVGTGPWMLTDFVSGSSFTYSKNPDYWGNDPRYPQNQTPYADTLKMLVIPDSSTRLAGLRSGQIDAPNNGAGGLTWQDSQQLAKTNSDIIQIKMPAGASGIAPRVDVKPFTDIRVRIALDMAIDRAAIAKSFYGSNASSTPSGMLNSIYAGITYAYADWPQSLKDEYAYNSTGAKQLLADAGYPDGFDTNVVVASDATQVQLMELFKSYFADIGVNMEINSMDNTAEQAFVRAGKHDQMSAQGSASTFPPTRLIDVFYSKGGTDSIFFGLNNAPDTTYDTLHDQFLAATDVAEANNLLQQMDKDVIEKHYVVSAPEYYTFMVNQSWLKGYSGEVTQWGQGITWSRLWTTKK